MAKTVRQQLADLAGGKKPNVFYKGLNSDIDEHLIGNEQFTDAMNVRINSKDSDNGTIQNLESNILLEKISLSAFRFNPVPSLNLSLKFWHDGALNTSNDETLQNIKLKFTKSDGSLINFGTGAFDCTALTGTTYQDSNNKGIFKYQPPTNFLALCTTNLNE